MGLEWHARERIVGPAGTAILASAALGVSMTMLAGAGASTAPDGTISTVAGGVGGPAGQLPVGPGYRSGCEPRWAKRH